MRASLPYRNLLLPVLLLLTTGALADQLTIVSLEKRPVPLPELEQGIERCQRDAAELGIADCIERFQVPLWRLDREADARYAESAPLRREVEGRVLAERVTEELLARAPSDDEAVASYLRDNQAAWASPERLRLFRILVGTSEQAQSLIATLGHKAPADFRAAAREHSLDQASHERGGDLGFVAADGTTDLPAVRADPALFEAARMVEDGAFVPKPVAEGNRFAVVWRRGSLPARRLTDTEAHAWAQERVREAVAGREIDRLLASSGAERRPDLLARFRRSECRLFAR